MAHTRLSDATVRALKPPPSGQVDYWDQTPGFKGFGVRVSQGGSKTFILLLGRNQRRTSLGRYPLPSLSKAREKATILFADALTIFFSSHCDRHNRARTAYETKRLLNRHFLPEFERMRLADVKAARVAEMVDDIEGLSERRHAFTALRTFFRFAVRPRAGQNQPVRAASVAGG